MAHVRSGERQDRRQSDLITIECDQKYLNVIRMLPPTHGLRVGEGEVGGGGGGGDLMLPGLGSGVQSRYCVEGVEGGLKIIWTIKLSVYV